MHNTSHSDQKPCLSALIKEFLSKTVNLKINDCSGSTKSPYIPQHYQPSITSQQCDNDNMGVGIQILGSEGKKPAKKFILTVMCEHVAS